MIIWNVGDLKISYVDPDVALDILKDINDQYINIDPLKINRGKTYDYLGMKIDFSSLVKAIFTMVDSIGNF